jgi:hypothetical protein
MGWRKDKLGRWRYSHRCTACERSLNKVPPAPLLRDAVWNQVANKAELLCAPCLFERMTRVLGRDTRLADLHPCVFNLLHTPHSWFELFMITAKRPPRNIAEWRAIALREKYAQAMAEKHSRQSEDQPGSNG